MACLMPQVLMADSWLMAHVLITCMAHGPRLLPGRGRSSCLDYVYGPQSKAFCLLIKPPQEEDEEEEEEEEDKKNEEAQILV